MKTVLPQYYRNITAKIGKHLLDNKRRYYIALVSLEGVLFLVLLAGLAYFYIVYMQLRQERVEALRALSSWEKLMNKYPSYPQTYYGAAVYALRLKDFARAQEYLEEALSIDPDFEAAKKLKREIE